MSEIAINTAGTGVISTGGLLSSLKSKIHSLVHRKISTSELVFLAVTLSFLQILDGILTCIGVMSFGSNLEANYFIRLLIESWGPIPALLFVKSIAFAIILTLCSMVHRVTWLATALKGIIVLYLFAAVVPWTMILAFNSI